MKDFNIIYLAGSLFDMAKSSWLWFCIFGGFVIALLEQISIWGNRKKK
jgi:hypothetical protein